MLFVGEDAEHGEELWITDGSESGTGLLMDTVSGDGTVAVGDTPFLVVGDRAYFRVADEEGRVSLWQTDGSTEGTQQISPSDVELDFGVMAMSAGGIYVVSSSGLMRFDVDTNDVKVVSDFLSLNIVGGSDSQLFFVGRARKRWHRRVEYGWNRCRSTQVEIHPIVDTR